MRASPPAMVTRCSRASSAIVRPALSSPRSRRRAPGGAASSTASSSSGSSRSSRHRESSGVLSEKYGFSVVAPISVTVPSSTAGSSTSCCAFDHRCTSSTKSTVRKSPPRAPSITLRASATPEFTAESCISSAPTASASRWARVVLPVPAGPHRMIDGSEPLDRMRVSARSWPTRCPWPTNSSNVRGRMRAARGTSPTSAVSRRLGRGPGRAADGRARQR